MARPSELMSKLNAIEQSSELHATTLEARNLLNSLSKFKARVSLSDLERDGINEVKNNSQIHSTYELVIPRSLIQFWDSDSPPLDVLPLIRSWRDVNPSMKYTLLNDKAVFRLLKESEFSHISSAYLEIPHPVDRSDIARLIYLYRYGGIYIDADHSCVWPIEYYIDFRVPHVFVRRGAKGNRITNSFMASTPLSPLFKRILLKVDNLFGTDEWKMTKIGDKAGRRFIERSIREMAKENSKSTSAFCDFYPANICLRSFQRTHHGLEYKENHWSSENNNQE
jgi:mannosyltransferase OCH1-like enzyme